MYKAFISYKHELDTSSAERIESALKSYAKPLLQKPFKIFRDEKHFTTGIDLPNQIRTALDDSEFLILLASPAAASSSWVEDELKHWCTRPERVERLIIVLLDGDIAVDDATKRIDVQCTTALPASICEILDVAPLYLDLRRLRIADAGMLHPRFRDAINRISARFRNVDPNEMIGSEVRQHKRNLWLRNAAVCALTSFAAIATAFAFVANEQRKTANSRLLAAQALQPELRVDGSLQRALDAYALKPTRDADLALRRVWHSTSQVDDIFVTDFPIISTARRSDGRTVAFGGASGELAIWDVENRKGDLLAHLDGRPRITGLTFANSGDELAVLGNTGALCFVSVRAQSRRCHTLDLKQPVSGLYRLPGNRFLVKHDVRHFALVSIDGEILDGFDIEGTGHSAYVTAVAVHPSGQKIALATYDSKFGVMDLERREFLRLSGGGKIWGMSFSHGGAYLAVTTESGTLAIYGAPDWQRIASTQIDSGLNEVVFSADDQNVMASSDSSLFGWSIPRLTEKLSLTQLHRNRISGLLPGDTPNSFLSASEDGTAIAWQVSKTGVANRLPDGTADYSALAMDKAGQFLYAGDNDGRVSRFDLREPANEPLVLGEQSTMVRALALSPDEGKIAIGGQDEFVQVYSVRKQGRISRLPVSDHPFDYVKDLAFSHDGEKLYFASVGRLVQKRSIADGKVLWEKKLPLPTQANDSLCCISLDTTRGTLVIADDGGYIYQLAASDGQETQSPLPMHRYRVSSVSLAEPMALIVSAGADRRVRMFDSTGQIRCEVSDPDGTHIYASAHSLNGPYLFSVSDKSVGIWHSPDCRLIFGLPVTSRGKFAKVVASDDGSNVAWTKPGMGLWWLNMPHATVLEQELQSKILYPRLR